MTLLERLSVNGSISSEEMSKLSAIRAGLINAMECGQMHTMEFIRKTFEDCSLEEAQKLAEMVETIKTAVAKKVVEEHGADAWLALEDVMDASMIKHAGLEGVAKPTMLSQWAKELTSGKGPLGTAASAAILATLGLSLLHSAGQGIGMISNPIKGIMSRFQLKKDSERTLSEILEENPELKKDPKIIEYFGALQKFAPNTVATNKPLAESILKKMHQWGQIDPQTMAQLVEMEGRYIQNLSGGRGKGEGFKPMSPGDLASLSLGAGS